MYVHVVGGRVLADVLDQLGIDSADTSTGPSVVPRQQSHEQWNNDRARLASLADMDVGGKHDAVDVGPVEIKADLALTLLSVRSALPVALALPGPALLGLR